MQQPRRRVVITDRAALETAQRLTEMGVVVRSAELLEKAQSINDFNARGGNRAMRRAAKKATRRDGSRGGRS